MTLTTKAQVQQLVRQVADLNTRLTRAEAATATLQVRVDCYERMLDGLLIGLGIGRFSPLPTGSSVGRLPDSGESKAV